MNAGHLRERLDQKRREHHEAELSATEFARQEARERAYASKARAIASSGAPAGVPTDSIVVEHHESQAVTAAREADLWRRRATELRGEMAVIEALLVLAERHGDDKSGGTAKTEKLRVLMLGAGPEGELRVGREQARIRAAVRAATHRDWVEIDPHPAATTEHLLTGLMRFRPHVVHFSGHGSKELLFFERDIDERHYGAAVTAKAFARTLAAVDEPPRLVVLNSCASAPQAAKLIDTVPFAIGMSDSIEDMDAITYAAGFYAALCEGQSLRGANAVGKAAIELEGLTDHDLPTLFHAPHLDPGTTYLVRPPSGDARLP
ncbi:CHAT domain-containing protein [Streptomyces sp. NPDC052023]|uniref:CHAT domain-containing protein n=1 Tax=Streptomyces sp. NPDC052023 TaxID=3365681 RepID=UPI0037CE78C0